jgi:hypothetical protein
MDAEAQTGRSDRLQENSSGKPLISSREQSIRIRKHPSKKRGLFRTEDNEEVIAVRRNSKDNQQIVGLTFYERIFK